MYGTGSFGPELRNCVKVEVDVLGSPSRIASYNYDLCGRKATSEKVALDVSLFGVAVRR